ncbi:unnamed protein product [Chondrus crispus]|uniref:Uncharacterized protein n=1 Tax=Chondrus crispus TaxID=2769 RepID=R7QA56_CHOCR|nr:unnamed protein product [Chondrus crispus]CDF34929.1 unnamed protein product [Chondrus crispus]|eukprot:XP_005714748.1 unnamed protein product [Chondrus crispus]
MQSLCDSFAPLNHDPKCVVRSTGFASLYITVVTLFTWTIIFEYLSAAPDATGSNDMESHPIVGTSTPRASRTGMSLGENIRKAMGSPPSLSVILGIGLACVCETNLGPFATSCTEIIQLTIHT